MRTNNRKRAVAANKAMEKAYDLLSIISMDASLNNGQKREIYSSGLLLRSSREILNSVMIDVGTS